MLILTITKGSDIVDKSINPHINHVFWIWWYFYSPSKGCTWHGQVFQAWLDEVFKHFIHTTIRLDKFWMFFKEGSQTVCVVAEFKEIWFFRNQLYFMSWWSYPTNDITLLITVNFCQLTFSEKFFIRNWVPTWVFTKIDISLFQETLEHLSNNFFMVIISRTDEFIVWDIQKLPEVLNTNSHTVHILLWCDSCFFSLLLNLLAVFIKPSKVEDIIVHHTFVTCQDVTSNGCIGRTNMQFTRWVVDRCCDVECFCHFNFLSCVNKWANTDDITSYYSTFWTLKKPAKLVLNITSFERAFYQL